MSAAMSDQRCPVCGFGLGFAAWEEASSSQEICPSCGIQFGYDDAAGGDLERREIVYQDWRRRWVDGGMTWSSKQAVPPGWDPVAQLRHVRDPTRSLR
jgi:hypothetical protein